MLTPLAPRVVVGAPEHQTGDGGREVGGEKSVAAILIVQAAIAPANAGRFFCGSTPCGKTFPGLLALRGAASPSTPE
jgi:hypothetical protein